MVDPAPDQPPPPLAYAPRPPRLQRRSTTRWASLAIVTIAVVITAPKWGPPAWRRVILLYWQHQCMAFAGSPTAAAFDLDAGTGITPQSKAFQAFYRLLSPPGDRGAPVVFSHALLTPSGAKRLVVVQAYTYTDGASDESQTLLLTLGARVFRPGGLAAAPSQVLARDTGSFVIGANRPTQIFAGQIDPADPTHFVLSGVSNSKPFAVNGWLQDDETVAMDFRAKRPATTPAPLPGTPRRIVAP